MSSSKSVSHAVVAWTKKGDEVFTNELVEAISLKKLIINGPSQVGTEVSMQFKNELWLGKILSVHGSKGEADKKCKVLTTNQSAVSVENPENTGDVNRKRKANKKLFADYVSTAKEDSCSSAEDEPAVTPKGGKQNRPKKTIKRKTSEEKAKKTTTQKKRKTTEEKKQELSLLCQKLSNIEESILVSTPSSSTDKENEAFVPEDSSESDWSDGESFIIPAIPAQEKLKHPHFGGKRPKTDRTPPKCINVRCKEEKQTKDAEILRLREEIRLLKEEHSKLTEIRGSTGQGKMAQEKAMANGLTELVTGSGIWLCPNKLGAAIKDAENKSRTVLVRSLLCGFYSREELLTKNFKDLDRDVIEACVDFAMVAKLGQVKNAKKSELRQALRTKVNSMKFSTSNPGYFVEYRKTYSGPKKENNKDEANADSL